MQTIKATLLPVFGQIRSFIVSASFWLMAFIALLMRLFVTRPLGPLLALAIGCVWCWGNMPRVRQALQNTRMRASMWSKGCESNSLWFEHEGRGQIMEVVERLSAQGVCYCNLSYAIDLPPITHWYAISRSLSQLGISSQVSGGTYYISWILPDAEAV